MCKKRRRLNVSSGMVMVVIVSVVTAIVAGVARDRMCEKSRRINVSSGMVMVAVGLFVVVCWGSTW